MSVHTRYYFGPPGQTFFSDAALWNVKVLCVTRSTLVHYEAFGTPANLQFVYTSSSGRFDFLNPFHDPLLGGIPGGVRSLMEKVSVKYKI